MRVLLIHCHPRSDSFSAALCAAAAEALDGAGHAVQVQDLYRSSFTPVLTPDERARYYDEDRNRGAIEPFVRALEEAEALLLVYPTWWFGFPAMLKGWLDRVWVPGVAFRLDGRGGLTPRLVNIRRIGVVTTYGSPRWLLWWVGWPDWRLISRGVKPLCARNCRLDWIALCRMDTCTVDERERFLRDVRRRLARWR
jgi:putative NADPH-quinone reductase